MIIYLLFDRVYISNLKNIKFIDSVNIVWTENGNIYYTRGEQKYVDRVFFIFVIFLFDREYQRVFNHFCQKWFRITNFSSHGQKNVKKRLVLVLIITIPRSYVDSCAFGSTKYFLLCGLGGFLSCGITHAMVTPLDLVKCRLQVDQAKYKNVVHGFKVSAASPPIVNHVPLAHPHHQFVAREGEGFNLTWLTWFFMVFAQITLKEDGFKGLAKGWAPTFWGYAAQVSGNDDGCALWSLPYLPV